MQHKIIKKIDRLRYYLNLLDKYKVDCKDKFLNDPMYEGALLHYLYLVSDGSISLAEMIIKYKKTLNKDDFTSYIVLLFAVFVYAQFINIFGLLIFWMVILYPFFTASCRKKILESS
jgi:hypothetical protein